MDAIVQRYRVLELNSSMVSSPYIGPGDVVGSAWAYWGLRAYQRAGIGSNAVRLRRDSDNAEQDFVTVSGGGIDLAAITAFKGAANLFVRTLYDQTGQTRNLEQPTAAAQPPFTMDVGDGRPSLDNTAGNTVNLQITTPFILAQPYTLTALIRVVYPDLGSSFGALLATHNNAFGLYWEHPNKLDMFGSGVTATITEPDNTWHYVQGVNDGATSSLNADSSGSGSVNVGTQNCDDVVSIIADTAGGKYAGWWREGGIWPVAFSAGQITAMNSNSHLYWGFV